MAIIRYQAVTRFHPKKLVTEDFYNFIDDTNYIQVFEKLKSKGNVGGKLLKLPAAMLGISAVLLSIGIYWDNSLLIFSGFLLAFYFGFGLVFTTLSISRVSENNKNLINILTLISIEKINGLKYQEFYSEHLKYWYPGKVSKKIKAHKFHRQKDPP